MGTSVSAEVMDAGERRGKRGRRLLPEARRRELIEDYLRSGLTRMEFARRTGVKYTTLCNWVQHAEPQTPAVEAEHTRGKPLVNFAEVALIAGGPARDINDYAHAAVVVGASGGA
jgi:transposase-like protein